MPGQNLSAKVSIQELPNAPGAIVGVTTSTVATAGWTARGRTDQIVSCSGYGDVLNQLGDFWTNSYINYCLNGFFSNNGVNALVQRITPSNAVVATAVMGDPATSASTTSRALTDPLLTLSSTHYNIKVQIDAFAATTIDVTADVGVAGTYSMAALQTNINAALAIVDPSLSNVCSVYVQTTLAGTVSHLVFTSPSTGATSQIIFTAPAADDATLLLFGFATHTSIGLAAVTPQFTINALGAGLWGNDLELTIQGDGNFTTPTGGWTQFDALVLEELNGNGIYNVQETYSGVVLDDDTSAFFMPNYIGTRSSFISVVEGVDFGIPRALTPVTVTNEVLGLVPGNGSLTTFTGRLLNLPNSKNVNITTTITGPISVNVTDNGTGSFAGTGVSAGTINYATGDISITFTAAVTSATLVLVTYTYTPDNSVTYVLTNGLDGTGPLTEAEVTSPSLSASNQGIYAFNTVTDQVLQLILPDFAGSIAVSDDLIAYAESRADIFVILDPPAGMSASGMVSFVVQQAQFNTSYAAIYWPWLSVPDPLANSAPKNIPPSGHIAGVYARTDQNRTVAKAPAGVNDGKLNNTLGFELGRTTTLAQRDTVYPNRINPLIGENQTGRAVWGARTLSLDTSWKYIQARRFFLFVEKSIYVNSWWSVFETIGPDLFSRIYVNVYSFLRGLLVNGYFPTNQESQAFAIIVDSSNNTPETAALGQVIIDIYLAPSTPGEFISFRFRQLIATS